MAGLADDLMTARRNRPPQGTLSAELWRKLGDAVRKAA